jgi:hypothetical protein
MCCRSGAPFRLLDIAVRRLVVAVLVFGLLSSACSSARPSPQARATAETCGVFSGHAETKQIEMAATEGQRSGDGVLRLEARQLQSDLALATQRNEAIPWAIDIHKMALRCGTLGFHVAQGW